MVTLNDCPCIEQAWFYVPQPYTIAHIAQTSTDYTFNYERSTHTTMCSMSSRSDQTCEPTLHKNNSARVAAHHSISCHTNLHLLCMCGQLYPPVVCTTLKRSSSLACLRVSSWSSWPRPSLRCTYVLLAKCMPHKAQVLQVH